MIQNGKQVAMEYSVFLDNGQLVDTNVGEAPLIFYQGMHQILPALEEEISQLDVGLTKKVTLSPEKAFGQVDPTAYREVESGSIPEEMRYEGAILGVQDEMGNQYRIRIHEINGEKAVIDFNHPLAGKTLTFEVKILEVK